MAAIPTLENRIVNIKQTTADGVVSIQEAELRHIDVHRDENSTPIRIKVVLAKAWGVQLNMPWNVSKGKFVTEMGGTSWESDFDYTTFIPSSWHGTGSWSKSKRSQRTS